MTAASPIRIWDIPGGIHPQENKLQSLGHGIETPPLPRELIVPLQQHIGARAEPCVAVSEKVLKGQPGVIYLLDTFCEKKLITDNTLKTRDT